MPFNKDISGYRNEEEFANYLNGKKFGRIYPIFQDLLYKLYGKIGFMSSIRTQIFTHLYLNLFQFAY